MYLSAGPGRTEASLLRDICGGETYPVDDFDGETRLAGQAEVVLASYRASFDVCLNAPKGRFLRWKFTAASIGLLHRYSTRTYVLSECDAVRPPEDDSRTAAETVLLLGPQELVR
ncbi:hypothetical protein O1611_g4965 [Lasiodiplodia mahajangana]|uniref:Uncharacterized protein n=1 Tax=Lasiodiplodia mahajangana TaxID=1108764 RepID=A0ACC2JMJ3_9PEZI|nr:hypothetical protein O1611_g4965 [Lasiodiplodia mahajangana]